MRFISCCAALIAASATAGCGNKLESLLSSPTSPATAAAVVKTLQVAASRVPCTGVAQQLCLQVRESSSAPWTLLYDAIVGFDYEPGFLYEIRVKVEAVANAPADASSLRRTLVALLSKTRVDPALVGPTWRLTALNGSPALDDVRVTAVFGDDGRVTGSAGCNRYFGGARADGAQITVGVLASTRMHCGDVVLGSGARLPVGPGEGEGLARRGNGASLGTRCERRDAGLSGGVAALQAEAPAEAGSRPGA